MKEKIDALKETFLLLPEWADRYNYLVELGESLPAMPVAFQVKLNASTASDYQSTPVLLGQQANTAYYPGYLSGVPRRRN